MRTKQRSGSGLSRFRTSTTSSSTSSTSGTTKSPRSGTTPCSCVSSGDAALAVRDEGALVGYLLGIVSSARGEDGRPWAYVHMVAVRRSHRRRGLAEALYERFFEHARRAGCSTVRATASPHNEQSYAFHSAIGMTPIDQGTVNGVPVVPDYFGPGKPRVVFEFTL